MIRYHGRLKRAFVLLPDTNTGNKQLIKQHFPLHISQTNGFYVSSAETGTHSITHTHSANKVYYVIETQYSYVSHRDHVIKIKSPWINVKSMRTKNYNWRTLC